MIYTELDARFVGPPPSFK